MALVCLPHRGLRVPDRDLQHLCWLALELPKRGAPHTHTLTTLLLPFLAVAFHGAPIAAGELHTCAVKASGELVCFGNHGNGRCDVPADLGPVRADLAAAQADALELV